VVYSGSEEASIKIAREAAKQRKPLLFYFYEPQWLHAEAEFARVALPPWREGCDRVPAQVACDYPQYILEKIVSRKFALKGGDTYELIENFSWSNKDQNEVASYIANDGMSPRQAAERWASEHPREWEAWLPANG
jgi:glycine betaine/proline transport system substrate-binding protein